MRRHIYAVCPKCWGRESVSPATSRVVHQHDGMDWACALVETLAQAQDCQRRWRKVGA